MELCPAAIAKVEKINSWETLSLAKGQLGHVYAVQGKRQEALEIADKLRRRSMQQYKDPFISPESTRSSERKTWPSSGCRRPANHSPAMLSIHQGPDYDRLRSDPRFQDLIHRVSLP